MLGLSPGQPALLCAVQLCPAHGGTARHSSASLCCPAAACTRVGSLQLRGPRSQLVCPLYCMQQPCLHPLPSWLLHVLWWSALLCHACCAELCHAVLRCVVPCHACCAVLSCAALCWAVPCRACCAALRHAAPHRAMRGALCWALWHRAMPGCAVLSCAVPCCTALCRAELCRAMLRCATFNAVLCCTGPAMCSWPRELRWGCALGRCFWRRLLAACAWARATHGCTCPRPHLMCCPCCCPGAGCCGAAGSTCLGRTQSCSSSLGASGAAPQAWPIVTCPCWPGTGRTGGPNWTVCWVSRHRAVLGVGAVSL